jgi:hypothetical protein
MVPFDGQIGRTNPSKHILAERTQHIVSETEARLAAAIYMFGCTIPFMQPFSTFCQNAKTKPTGKT